MPWHLQGPEMCTAVHAEIHRNLIEPLWPLSDKVEVLSIAMESVRTDTE